MSGVAIMAILPLRCGPETAVCWSVSCSYCSALEKAIGHSHRNLEILKILQIACDLCADVCYTVTTLQEVPLVRTRPPIHVVAPDWKRQSAWVCQE